MKVFSSACIFDYPWEEVSTAVWRKYCPWNDRTTHVTAVDTLSRSVDPSTNILRTERLITCQQTAPAWVMALLGGSNMSHVYEVSYVDPAAKKVTMVSTNLTWANILSVRECVTYSMMGRSSSTATAAAAAAATTTERSDHERTKFSQEAKITALCGGWQKIRSKIEEASVERFGENAKKGKEGFERVLEMSRRVFGEEQQRQQQRAMAR